MATGVIHKYMDGNDTGWVAYTGTSEDEGNYTGTIYTRKIGSIVQVKGYGLRLKTALAASSSVLLLQLPSGVRPPEHIGFAAMTNAESENLQLFPMLINSNGKIFFNTNADTSIGVGVNINFVTMYML